MPKASEQPETEAKKMPSSFPLSGRQLFRDKVLPLILMGLAVIFLAGVPLDSTTRRRTAEHQITTLENEIIVLQEKKARRSSDLADKLALDKLENLGRTVGLGPPEHIEYVTVPAEPVTATSSNP